MWILDIFFKLFGVKHREVFVTRQHFDYTRADRPGQLVHWLIHAGQVTVWAHALS